MQQFIKRSILIGMGASMLLSAPSVSWAGTSTTAKKAVQIHSAQGKHASANTYTVAPRDTLWGIARSHGISISTLKQRNGLHSNIIRPGQHLKLLGIRVTSAKSSASKASKLHVATVKKAPMKSVHTVHIAGAPSTLVPVYEAAGRKFGIPWTVLAAIHKKETSFRTTHCPVSSEGARGPMQFLPATFKAYGVTAPGNHGAPNINNVKDAIYTAAHFLAAHGYAASPTSAIFSYNRSKSYVRSVLSIAKV